MKNKMLEEIPELTRFSSRGQVVIPQDIRERMHIKEGSVFAVTSPKQDMIVLKKIENPMLKRDLLILGEVEKAWKEIERGEFRETSKNEFLKELEKL